MTQLSKPSVGQIIRNIEHPEWGQFKIIESRASEGFVCLHHVERGSSHSKLLYLNEFKFWTVEGVE